MLRSLFINPFIITSSIFFSLDGRIHSRRSLAFECAAHSLTPFIIFGSKNYYWFESISIQFIISEYNQLIDVFTMSIFQCKLLCFWLFINKFEWVNSRAVGIYCNGFDEIVSCDLMLFVWPNFNWYWPELGRLLGSTSHIISVKHNFDVQEDCCGRTHSHRRALSNQKDANPSFVCFFFTQISTTSHRGRTDHINIEDNNIWQQCSSTTHRLIHLLPSSKDQAISWLLFRLVNIALKAIFTRVVFPITTPPFHTDIQIRAHNAQCTADAKTEIKCDTSNLSVGQIANDMSLSFDWCLFRSEASISLI